MCKMNRVLECRADWLQLAQDRDYRSNVVNHGNKYSYYINVLALS
jgi:hypothetical protein